MTDDDLIVRLQRQGMVSRFKGLDYEVEELAAASAALAKRRRAILLELRATGMNMQAVADAVGLTRARVYRILGELPDHRKHGPPPGEPTSPT